MELESQKTFLCTGWRAVIGGTDERMGRDWKNGRGDSLDRGKVCLRLGVCGCVGGYVQGWNTGSRVYGDMAVEVGVGVPMVTPVKDGHCGDGRAPYESKVVEETQILMVKQAGFDFLGDF